MGPVILDLVCFHRACVYNSASMIKIFFAAVMLMTFAAAAQDKKPVEITSEPHHHQVLKNSFVRVFAVTVAPKESTLMHRHDHNYIGITLGDSEIANAKEGQQPAQVKLKDGDTRYSAAPLVHAVTDSSDSKPFHNVTIELLQSTTNEQACKEGCSIPVQCEGQIQGTCATVEKLFSANEWTATQVTIPAGGTYPQHSHSGSFLSVPLTDAKLKVRSQAGRETTEDRKVGEVRWSEPVTHTISNAGSNPIKVVVIEFSGKAAGELPR